MWIDISYLIKKRKWEHKEEIESAQLPKEWNNVINKLHPELASYTQYGDIKKDTLYIKVSDNFLISELEARKEGIRSEINKNRKKPINTIRFTI